MVLAGFGGAVLGFVAKEIWAFFFRREAVTQKECQDRRSDCAGHIKDDLARGSGCFDDIEKELGLLREVAVAQSLAVLEMCKDRGPMCDELKRKLAILARGH